MQKFLLYSLLLLVINNALAQRQVIFSNSETANYSVSLNSGDTDYNKNRMLQLIANGNSKNSAYTAFNIRYKQHLNIEKYGASFIFKFSISDVNIGGDIYYRDFNVVEYLMPDKANFELKWQKAVNKAVIDDFSFEVNLPDNFSRHELANFSKPDTTNYENFLLTVHNMSFTYNNNTRRGLEDKAKMIDEYYKEAENLKRANYDLSKINPSDYQNIDEYMGRVKNIADYVRALKRLPYSSQLNLNYNDPINLQNQIQNLEQNVRNVQADLEETYRRLPEIYYNQGLDYVNRGMDFQAEASFVKSIGYNARFAPSHYELAELYYRQKNVEKTIAKLEYILTKLNADAVTRQKSEQLAKIVYETIMAAAKNWNINREYKKALRELEVANTITGRIPGLRTSIEWEAEMKTAHSGIFDMLLDEAIRDINNEQLAAAGRGLEYAEDYYRRNGTYLQGQTYKIDNQWQQLYDRHRTAGQSQLSNDQYESALENFYAAQNICANKQAVNCETALETAIKQAHQGIYDRKIDELAQLVNKEEGKKAESLLAEIDAYFKKHGLTQHARYEYLKKQVKIARYGEYMNLAVEQVATNDLDKALENFANALDLVNKFQVPDARNAAKRLEQAAVDLCGRHISNGLAQVAINNLQQARMYYNAAKDVSRTYLQARNTAVNKDLDGLQKQIFTQACNNRQNEYDQMLESARKEADKLLFANADDYLNRALQFAQLHAECEISTQAARDFQDDIQAPKKYQAEYAAIDNLIDRGIFDTALEQYIELENFFYDYRLEKFNIQYENLYNFARENDSRFVLYATKHAIRENKLDEARSLLAELERRQYRRSYTKNSQQLLGEALAERDHAQQQNASPKELVLNYTNDNNWFRYLKRAYLKKMKKL